jgi:hypothetical protein
MLLISSGKKEENIRGNLLTINVELMQVRFSFCAGSFTGIRYKHATCFL